MDEEKIAALIQWINCLSVGPHLNSLKQLYNGHHFIGIINILKNGLDKSDLILANWQKTVGQFLEDYYGMRVEAMVDMKLAAEKQNELEIAKAAVLILCASINYEGRERFLNPLTKLQTNVQMAIKAIIEGALSVDCLSLNPNFSSILMKAGNVGDSARPNEAVLQSESYIYATDCESSSPIKQFLHSPQIVQKMAAREKELLIRKLKNDLRTERDLKTELEQDVTSFKEQIHKQDNEISKLKMKIVDLRMQTSDLVNYKALLNDKEEDLKKLVIRCQRLEGLLSDYNCFKTSNECLLKEKTDLEERLEKLDKAYKSSNLNLKVISDLELKLESIKSALIEKDEMISSLNICLKEKDSLLTEMRDIQKEQETIRDLESMSTLQTTVLGESMSVVTDMMKLEELLAEKELVLTKQQNEIDRLSADALSKADKIIDLEALRLDLEGRERRLEDDKRTLLCDVQASQEKIEQLNLDVKTKNDVLEKLRGELQKYTEECSKLGSDLAEKDSHMRSVLEEHASEKNALVANLKKQNAAALQELEERNEVGRLKNEIELRIQLDKAVELEQCILLKEKYISQLEKHVADKENTFKESLGEKDKRLEALGNELQLVKTKLSETNAALWADENKIRSLEEVAENVKQTNAELLQKLEVLEGQRNEAQLELSNSRSEVTRLLHEFSIKEGHIKELEMLKSQLELDSTKVLKEREIVLENFHICQEKLEQLGLDMNAKDDAVLKMQQDLEKCKGEIGRLHGEVTDKDQELRMMCERHLADTEALTLDLKSEKVAAVTAAQEMHRLDRLKLEDEVRAKCVAVSALEECLKQNEQHILQLTRLTNDYKMKIEKLNCDHETGSLAFEAKIQALHDECQQKETQLGDTEMKLKSLVEDLDRIKQERYRLDEELKLTLEKQLQEKQSFMTELKLKTDENDGLRTDLCERDGCIRRLETLAAETDATFTILEQEKVGLQLQTAAVHEKLAQSVEYAGDLEANLLQTQESLVKREADIRRLNDELLHKYEGIKGLCEEHRIEKDSLLHDLERHKMMNDQLRRASEELRSLKTDHASVKSEVSEFKEKFNLMLKQSEKRWSAHEVELRTEKEENKKLLEVLRVKEEDIRSLQASENTLQSNYEKLEKETEAVGSELIVNQEKVGNLDLDLARAREAVLVHEETVKRLTGEAEAMQKNYQDAEEQHAKQTGSLICQLEHLAEKHKQVEEVVNDKESIIKRIQNEINGLVCEKEICKQEFDSQIETVQTALRQKEGELGDISETLLLLQKENASLMQTESELRGEIQRIQERKNKATDLLNAQLDEECAELERVSKDLTKKVEETQNLEELVAVLEETVTLIKNENTALLESMNVCQAEKESLSARVQETNENLVELKRELEVHKGDTAKLHSELGAKDVQLQLLNQQQLEETKSMMRELSSQKDANEKLKETIRGNQEQIKQLEELAENLAKKGEQLRDLESLVLELEAKAALVKDENMALLEAMNACQAEKESLSARVQETNENLVELKRELEVPKGDTAKLRSELGAKDVQLQLLNQQQLEETKSMMRELSSQKDANEKLKETIRGNQEQIKQLEELAENLAKKGEQLRDLESLVPELEAKAALVKDENMALLEAMNACQAEKESLSARVQETGENLLELKRELEVHKGDTEKLRDELSAKNTKLKVLQQQHLEETTLLMSELALEKEANEKFDDAIRDNQRQIKQLEELIEDLLKKVKCIQDLELLVEELEAKVTLLKDENASMLADMNAGEATRETLGSRLHETSENLLELKRELEGKISDAEKLRGEISAKDTEFKGLRKEQLEEMAFVVCELATEKETNKKLNEAIGTNQEQIRRLEERYRDEIETKMKEVMQLKATVLDKEKNLEVQKKMYQAHLEMNNHEKEALLDKTYALKSQIQEMQRKQESDKKIINLHEELAGQIKNMQLQVAEAERKHIETVSMMNGRIASVSEKYDKAKSIISDLTRDKEELCGQVRALQSQLDFLNQKLLHLQKLERRETFCRLPSVTLTCDSLETVRLNFDDNKHDGSRELLNAFSINASSRDLASNHNFSMMDSSLMLRPLNGLPSGAGSCFPCEEEQGEFLNFSYLNDLKSGNCEFLDEAGRIEELQRRNSLCLPHLRSSYPVETQVQPLDKFKDEDVKVIKALSEANLPQKLNSTYSLPSGLNDHPANTAFGVKPKVKGILPAYRKPGPPTPGKSKSPLASQNKPKSKTPSSIKRFLRPSKFPTPKGFRIRGSAPKQPGRENRVPEDMIPVVRRNISFSVGFSPKVKLQAKSMTHRKELEQQTSTPKKRKEK